MINTATGTVVAHDDRIGASWISWEGMRVRVPLASKVAVGSSVAWRIPSEQVRLPSRSGKPVRGTDTEFRAKLLAIVANERTVEMTVKPLRGESIEVEATPPQGSADRHGIS